MGLETGSFEHDFVAMYYIQSGIPVLFTAPIVQRGLEAAQPETSGECGPWVVPGLGTARNCGWILSLVPHVRVLLLSLREQDSKNTLALKDLNYLELQICILAPAVHTHTHTHSCVLDSLYQVWLLPCSVCGLWQDVPFGVCAFRSWREQMSAPSLCCTFKTFTGCYIDCEWFRRQIGCSCVLVLLTFWVTFFLSCKV